MAKIYLCATEDANTPAAELVGAACKRFLQVRGKGDLYKKPGTSEFLDWLEALWNFRKIPDVVENLKQEEAKLHYPELLFKLRADWRRHTTGS
jgi:hypothetical protein